MKLQSKILLSMFAAASLSGCGWFGGSKKDEISVVNKAGGCKVIVTNGKAGDLLCPPKACPAPAPKPEENDCNLDGCGGTGGASYTPSEYNYGF